MPYIFRKYKGYRNDIQGWTVSSAINTENFDEDELLSRSGASKAGTSIPSPTARMELFDTAFHIVGADTKNNLKGTSIYHQLVSDCLDVMQLLFNASATDMGSNKKIEFKEWRVRENIDKLITRGPDHAHSVLAKALSQVFDTNIGQAGFTEAESIFLIYYENKLLGGTSPLTLFFTSPNWKRYVNDGQIIDMPRGSNNSTLFDSNLRALYERDPGFVEYLYKLLLKNPAGFEKCTGLRKYINKTINLYFDGFKQRFGDWKIDGPMSLDTEYDKIKTNVEGKFLAINGISFYHQKEEQKRQKIKTVSDFLIRPSNKKYATQRNKEGNEVQVDPPLVLVDGMNIPGDYLEKDSLWDTGTRVKYFLQKSTPLYERKLPQGDSLTITYPFITTEDFLEDYLIELPYTINRLKFFTGVNGKFKYLLPIKKEYFNFFNVADLKDNLTIELRDTEVELNLNIPINNKKGIRAVTFKKIYATDRAKKQIIDCRADIGIFPFYKITDPDKIYSSLNDYTVLLAEKNERIKIDALNFYTFSTVVYADNLHPDKINVKMHERSGTADVESFITAATSKYYHVSEAFDYIEFKYSDRPYEYSGIVIPNFENRVFNKGNLNKSMVFAIDFGTSNTHVAYKDHEAPLPQSFEIGEEDQQMVLLNEPGNQNDNLSLKYAQYGNFPNVDIVINREFVPPIIKANSDNAISFPFKTATCEIALFNNMDKMEAELFSHINIGFHIEKEGQSSRSVHYTTNLKWLLEDNPDVANRYRVLFFLRQLMVHIKAKAILNYCMPDHLDILWSIPSSMDQATKSQLKRTIKEAFMSVFPYAEKRQQDLLDEPIKEAIAPYFFLTKNGGLQEGANIINVDIGGGTTDIMMFMESIKERSDKYLTTSFRFAGGDLWGGGFQGRQKDNGFLKNYNNFKKANNIAVDEYRYVDKALKDNELNSDDLVGVLFKYDQKFQFSNSITNHNTDLSIVLYIHYAAIIYHICQILTIRSYPLPRYISFTGKGSQYLKLLCNHDEGELNKFTKLLLNTYASAGDRVKSSFSIHISEDPKIITANGAIMYHVAVTADRDPEQPFVEIPKNASVDDVDDDVVGKRRYQEFIHPGYIPGGLSATSDLQAPGHEFLIADTEKMDGELNKSVLENLNRFLETTLTNKNIVEFLTGFKVKNAAAALEVLKWDGDLIDGEGYVYDSYKKVLKNLQKQDRQNPLSESLFFFGLKDALYRLSKFIIDKKP